MFNSKSKAKLQPFQTMKYQVIIRNIYEAFITTWEMLT